MKFPFRINSFVHTHILWATRCFRLRLLSRIGKKCNILLRYIVKVGNNLSIKSRKKQVWTNAASLLGENSESHLLFRGGANSEWHQGWVGCGGVAKLTSGSMSRVSGSEKWVGGVYDVSGGGWVGWSGIRYVWHRVLLVYVEAGVLRAVGGGVGRKRKISDVQQMFV